MIIQIDLLLLEKLNLNINEYLTIIKINELNNNSDIPFNTDIKYLGALEEKKFIKSSAEELILTDKAIKQLKLTSIDESVTEVLKYFKQITNKTRIDITSVSNRKYIKDRLQKYTKQDLKNVIDIKNNEWKDSPSMSKYIRIETLFNQEKFQKYINEVDSKMLVGEVNSNIRRI